MPHFQMQGGAAIRDAVMKSREIAQREDELIGEAVLALLKSKSPINAQALIVRLRAMQAEETDEVRREALARVIEEISHMALRRRRRTLELETRDRETGERVTAFYHSGKQQGTDKIH